LVNIASEVDGAQIGLVNIAKNGRIQAEAFATNTLAINAGIRFVSGYSYSELALGYDPIGRDNQYSGGLGAHFDVRRFTIEAGVHGSSTHHPDTSEKPTRVDLHYRGRVGYRVTSFIEPFVGGGARHGLYGLGKDEVDPEVLAGVALF
jgi:opacity protein-like surface antigen